MTEKATILIPDISGFTEFVTKTELDHSAHIINELLNLIIEQNYSGFSLSEIEGDAVLFYKKGEILSKGVLVKQCLDIFSKFHEQLKLFERDIVCRCGACQTASQLSLKFIIHYGTIKEFKIANLVKASGVDMIIAHRLLKNNIKLNEYILLSSSCLEYLPDKTDTAGLVWATHVETYPTIGEVKTEYADLLAIKRKIPSLPERETYIEHAGGDTIEFKIEAPIEEVYQKIIDPDLLVEYMVGITDVEHDPGVERIGKIHLCQTPDFKMEVQLEYAEFSGDTALVVNHCSIVGSGISGTVTDHLQRTEDNHTILTETNMWEIPPEMKQQMLAELKVSLSNFKALCEGQLPKKETIDQT